MKKLTAIILFLILAGMTISCTHRSTAHFFISSSGTDSNSGTVKAPFRSLQKAKSEVRELLKRDPGKPIQVYIKGGEYYLDEPIVFTAEDSGGHDNPIVYKAVEGEEPVFTGSLALKNWKILENPDKLKILSPEVKGKIYVVDLGENGIHDYGDPTEIGERPELFCNGEVQTLARWPNEGFVHSGRALGDTNVPENYTGNPGSMEGIFEYTNDRLDRWALEDDVRLGGYWYWDWSEEYQKVKRLDTVSNIIYIEQPYHRYGYKDSLRYFGLNLLCELDQPGEWYLDRTGGMLYWYPPEGVVPNQAEVRLSVFDAPFMIEMKNCSNVTFQGLAFEEGRGSAVSVSGGKECLISDCRIERFGEDGIHIDGGGGHGVSGCMLRTFGCGGIWMRGGDRKNLIPAHHFVGNTVVEHFSLFKPTYEPAVYLEGCGNRISNNRFRYSSSSAMRLEGNDLLVEYNEVSHVVNESDDQGGLDMWMNPSYRGNVIRYNHWSDITGGTRHGAAGVRLDDMISGVKVYGNIFERSGSRDFGGVQIHGGKDNVMENNLFYECNAAVSFTLWGEKKWMEYLESPAIKKKIYEDVDIRSDVYQERYPALADIRMDADVNTIKNNLLVGCKYRFLREGDDQVKINNTSVEKNGNSLEYFCSPDVLEDYGLQPIPFQMIGPKDNRWVE